MEVTTSPVHEQTYSLDLEIFNLKCVLEARRIVNGYTSAEFAFLLGFPAEYLYNLQTFADQYELIKANLGVAAFLLKCDIAEFSALWPDLQPYSHIKTLNVRYAEVESDNHRTIGAWIKLLDGSERFLLTLLEPVWPDDPFEARRVDRLFQTLFEQGTWNLDVDAIDIHEKICAGLGCRVRPRYVEGAIQKLIDKSTFPKMKRFEDDGVFMYRRQYARY